MEPIIVRDTKSSAENFAALQRRFLRAYCIDDFFKRRHITVLFFYQRIQRWQCPQVRAIACIPSGCRHVQARIREFEMLRGDVLERGVM